MNNKIDDPNDIDDPVAALKYVMAVYRISNECINAVFKKYPLRTLQEAMDDFDDPLTYVAEPDQKLKTAIKAILYGGLKPEPRIAPPYATDSERETIELLNQMDKIVKSKSDIAQRNFAKIRQMMVDAGIITNKDKPQHVSPSFKPSDIISRMSNVEREAFMNFTANVSHKCKCYTLGDKCPCPNCTEYRLHLSSTN